MAGKRQKASSELQGYGSAHRGETPLTLVPADARREVPTDARREVPAAPNGLPASLLPVWDAYWADHISMLVKPADAYDVGRYFVLLAEREKHERAIRAKPLVEGSMGQQVVNPRITLVKELSREIEKTREHLGILPLSRIRLNIADNVEKSGVADLRRKLIGAVPPVEPIEAEVEEIESLDEMA